MIEVPYVREDFKYIYIMGKIDILKYIIHLM